MELMHAFGRKIGLALVALGLLARVAAEPGGLFPYSEATIEQLQARLAAGTLTARVLTRAYLDRIAALNPSLGAVLEVNPDALAQADESDARRRAGQSRGPLDGIPVLLKDNIATADQMETTAGSLALVGSRPPRDAAIVGRLRAAGAVLLGKTNLSEWANFRGERSNSGWSGRGGFTRNPYALDRNPSGSSSGSAAAVSANFCVVAVGTETDGSILSPAGHCGVVGFKPTVGLVSRTGIIPISATQDTAGPMARTVGDAAILLSVLAGADETDPATKQVPAELLRKLREGLAAGALKGARIGIIRGGTGRPAVQAMFEAALSAMRAAGAEVVDKLEFKPSALGTNEEIVLQYEFKAGLNAYLATLGPNAPVRTLADVIAFNEGHADQELKYFGQETLVGAQARGPLTEKTYVEARANSLRLAGPDGIDALMEANHLDALFGLRNGPAGLIDPLNGDNSAGGVRIPYAPAGYPAVTVTAGSVGGMPVGIFFVGRAWSDHRLLALAADFERTTHARWAPELRSSATVNLN